MKTLLASPPTHKRGVALLIVLASLILLTVLVLAFLVSIGTETQSSKLYANGSSVKLLAQSAVNIVMAEVSDATANPALCWTSQPGMIRTYDNTGNNTSGHTQYYKLYSDSVMTGTTTFSPTDPANAVPTNWYQQQGVYVDLNQPINVSGANLYPILDGNSADLSSMTTSTSTTTAIAGFSVSSTSYADPSSANQAPMPVKWLYVLKQGEVIAPDSFTAPSGGNTVTFTNASKQPSTSDPIVGRMAFWTDDDTCKVNINTASEAANPWDTPRLNTTYDQQVMSYNQPVQNEFQRYPGHPATVCLDTVLGNWLPVPATGPTTITAANYASQLLPYYNLIPRVVGGTGELVSSSVSTTTAAGSGSQGGSVTPSSTANALTPDVDRLYNSPDELVFTPTRTASNPVITQKVLQQARFFLTAHSRAPDTNLFNQPRISMWPVSSVGTGMPNRSPADQLIAFCTTLNNSIYYFQRKDPNDQNTDLPATATTTGLGRNRAILEYLRYLTAQPIPGFGGQFGGAGGKYISTDVVGGSGISTTATDCDQILTEAFDYIRSTNTRDQSIATSASNPVTPYTVAFNTANGGSGTGNLNAGSGTGQVLPIVDTTNGTRGFGRFPTLQQVALVFYVSGDDQTSAHAPTQLRAYLVLELFDPSQGYPYTLPWYQVRVTGLSSFTWDGTSTNPMFAGSSDPAILANPTSVKTICSINGNGPMNLDPMVGGTVGVRRVMYYDLANPSTSQYLSLPYPSTSTLTPAATLSSQGIASIKFPGGTGTVTFYKTNPSSTPAGGTTQAIPDLTKPIQTIVFNLPSGVFPLPTVPSGTVPAGMNNPTTASPVLPSHSPTGTGTSENPGWESWANRASEFSSTTFQNGESAFISDNDVIRGITPNPGDLRLAAARQTINTTTASASFYQPHPLYSSSTAAFAHDLQSTTGSVIEMASAAVSGGIPVGGRLVPLVYDQYITTSPTIWQTNDEYNQQSWWAPLWSDVPTTTGVFVGGSGTVPGDWDNGIGNIKDGAYINKADEGAYSSGGNNYPYYAIFGQKSLYQTFFSPNRMVPSPGMLGSLPTGVLANKPWQTLLFRPGPAGHPGLGSPVNAPVGAPYTTPPDSLFMDLFTMPVVEPYAISEPLSTAGRINMNYQIIPFTYITRSTALQAALKSVEMVSIPNSEASNYKYNTFSASNPNGSNTYRFGLNIPATLTQFTARFANNDVFRAPAEICSIDLVPNDPGTGGGTAAPTTPTRANMDTYWANHELTGDNTRERPYANLYPLLTTRSNTFTVHFRVQNLQQAPGTSTTASEWREGTDVLTGEYRGAETIERYVDPNQSNIPDFAASPSTSTSLNSYYKFRVVEVKQFAP